MLLPGLLLHTWRIWPMLLPGLLLHTWMIWPMLLPILLHHTWRIWPMLLPCLLLHTWMIWPMLLSACLASCSIPGGYDPCWWVPAWPPAPYLEDMTHVGECLPGLLLHSPRDNLHGLGDEPNLTGHVQGVVHLGNKCDNFPGDPLYLIYIFPSPFFYFF